MTLFQYSEKEMLRHVIYWLCWVYASSSVNSHLRTP